MVAAHGSKGAVGAPVHAHATVAPALLRDPVDDRARILAVILERNDLARAATLAAHERNNTRVTVRGTFTCKGARIDIDRELEERRSGLAVVLGTNQQAAKREML